MQSNYFPPQEHYEEMSEIIKKAYNHSSQINVSVEIDKIVQWIHSDNTKPFLITSEQNGGKKTLICELMMNLERSKGNYLVISEFASASPYYSDILYKICMQLRTSLTIDQKVQLRDERLRQYFKYWLQIADKQIERSYLTYSKQQKRLVVIIIEGIDKMMDKKDQSVAPSFWFPDTNLKNVKIIMTCNKGTQIPQILMPIVSDQMEHVLSDAKVQSVKKKLLENNPKLECFDNNLHIGELQILSKMMQQNPKFEVKNEKRMTFLNFLPKFLKFCSAFIDNEQNLCKLLSCLIWSKKGITKNTLQRSTKIQSPIIQKFLVCFNGMINNNGQTYLITNRSTKEWTIKVVTQKLLISAESLEKQTHIALSKALKKENQTLNALQQMIHHLVLSQNFTELKEVLSRVQNFIALYTPLTKHTLCICWFQLQKKFQYDPVFEYNKAVERFLSHYYPSPEDTFKIIFQLSLFFKEYSEYESEKTPQFRHPPIKGEAEHLRQISVFEELVEMKMYEKTKNKTKVMAREQKDESSNRSDNQELQSIQQQQPKEQREVEKLNVKIKLHQDKFKTFYLHQMEDYINHFYFPKKKSLINEKDNVPGEQSDDSDNEMDESKVDIEKIRKSLILKKYSDYCEESYNLQSEKRSFYYYKQWIWMQFPWISMSLNNHFSQLIEKCMKIPTQYMPSDIEKRLIKDAIKVAQIAKQNKKHIFQNQNDSKNISIMTSKNVSPDNKSSNIMERSLLKSKTKTDKPKFDLSKLDDQVSMTTRKRREKSVKKENAQTFMTGINYENETQQKQNLEISQISKFPQIKCPQLGQMGSSRLSQKNVDVLETRQYGLLVHKYDEIRYENQQLILKIQKLKQNREVLKGNSKQDQKEDIRASIEELQQKKQKLSKNYKTQESFKCKLQMIIKLSELNKSHGSGSADLSNFLTSLKSMYKIESKNLDAIKLKAKQVLEQCKTDFKKIKEMKLNEQQRLKKQKNKWNKSMSIIYSENHQLVQPTNKKTFAKPAKESNRKQKLALSLDEVTRKFQKFAQIYGFISGQAQHNEDILQKLQFKVDKFHQIEWKLSELIDGNEAKQQKILQLEQKISVNKGHIEHERELSKRNLQQVMEQSISKAEQRYACLQKCLKLIDEQVERA